MFQIRQISISEIDVYEKIQMKFRVDSVFDVRLLIRVWEAIGSLSERLLIRG